ncbi:Satratoxin biosynthesis SC1 cluster protein 4 [Colletotrichum sidae]|uniref:Satratoxin biosynthesis SC1 cluster protein 4 n=1 Tax=Colletotrichum sidae TaxID=1347389 RepID=A0A4R8TL03_9PEZI|nr:Satratoxin biosynthesis SC1 cluster protein 4 [Colletotrichum sidae]
MSSSLPPPSTSDIDPVWAAESNTAMILGVTGGFHALALLFVALRVYTRMAVVKVMGRDDYVMVASVLCAVAGMTIFCVQSFHGLGRHTLVIPEASMVVMRRSSFFQSIISSIAGLALLKVSIGLSLLRLSRSVWYSRSLWALIVFVSAYSFMAWMTFFMFCQPLEGYWDKSIKPKCYPITLFIRFGLINTAFNIFTDVCFATLPVTIIWTLQMKLRTRIYLIVVPSLGYFAVAMGVIKSIYQIAYGKDMDKTFYQSIQFWEFLQLNLGIVAACAPSLKPLVGHALKISSGGDRYHGELYENRRPTGGTDTSMRRRGYRVRDSHRAGGYEMRDRPFAGSPPESRRVAVGQASRGVYDEDGRGSGSEELILRDDKGQGIMRTTEISIQR